MIYIRAGGPVGSDMLVGLWINNKCFFSMSNPILLNRIELNGIRYLREKHARRIWYAVTQFQALIRGFLSRHRLRKELQAYAAEKDVEVGRD